jgi:hypothetical protein
MYASFTARNRPMPTLLAIAGFMDNGQHQPWASDGSSSAPQITARYLPQRRCSQSGVMLSYNYRRDAPCPTSRSGSSHWYRLHCGTNKASSAPAPSTTTVQRRVLPLSCRVAAGGRASPRAIALSCVRGEFKGSEEVRCCSTLPC